MGGWVLNRIEMSKYSELSIEEQQYQKDKELHDSFIMGYQACIKDAERLLQKGQAPDRLVVILTKEKKGRQFMDAPNKPGYYRANND